MNIVKCIFATLTFILVCGCGSENTKLSKPNFVSKIVSSSTNFQEGERGTLSIATNITGEFSVDWQQESGPKTYFIVKNDNSIDFISPSIDSDAEIEFSAVITTLDQQSAKALIAFNVSNLKIEPITTIPKPNVFSDPNYLKHEVRNFDSTGIPMLTRSGEDYYYSVAIAAYGYDLYKALYKNYLSKGLVNNELQDKFIIVAEWLKDNCVYTEYGFCSFRSYFDIDIYRINTDWTSAMGQGQALSVLAAAHYLTGDQRYAEVAFDALAAFLYPIHEKGVTADFEGQLWYEEYGSEEMPVHVLNGFIFSLSGIYDLNRIYNDQVSSKILNVGIESLKNNIKYYDWNFTSLYSYSPLYHLASAKSGPDAYHELHIFQLAWLYNVTGEDVFKTYAAKFLAQDMAGIKTIPEFYDMSRKILQVEASKTIDAVNYGVDKVYDGYWSYRNYWSSYRFPVDLKFTLNSNIIDAGMLDRIILTSTTEEDFPSAFSLIEISDSGEETILLEDISISNTPVATYQHQVDVHKSFTVTFDVSVPITTNKMILRIAGADEGLVRIREVDFQYDRETVLESIIGFYGEL